MLAAHEGKLSLPEDRLLARCRMGDMDAFGIVYTQYERQVFRYAYHLLGNREDADDIKQETFLRAHRAISGFRSDCSLQTWLLKICGNLCRDKMKSRARRREVFMDPAMAQDVLRDSDRTSDPIADFERTEAVELALRALDSLPNPQREIILLYEVERLSYAQIAEILGISLASVKLRLFRARGRFRERAGALLRPEA